MQICNLMFPRSVPFIIMSVEIASVEVKRQNLMHSRLFWRDSTTDNYFVRLSVRLFLKTCHFLTYVFVALCQAMNNTISTY